MSEDETPAPRRIVPRKSGGKAVKTTDEIAAEAAAEVAERTAEQRAREKHNRDLAAGIVPGRKRGANRLPKVGSSAADDMLADAKRNPLTPAPPEGEVLVFRRPDNGRPVAVPSEVVKAAERPYRAYCDRLTGMSWEDVAVEHQYPNARSAAAEVNRYMEEGKAMVMQASAGALITLELARLDRLQTAIWPDAMAGVLPAVSVSMQLVLARVKLMGLDLGSSQIEGNTAPRTVIVPLDQEGYVKALQGGSNGGS